MSLAAARKMRGKKPKIIVIGAGISGLTAADRLIACGLTDVTILEATNRTGGRIWSVDVDKRCISKAELGANWIHGVDQNPVYTIADENHLLEMRYKGFRQQKKYITEDGEVVPKQLVSEVDWAYGRLMQECEEFFQMDIPTPYEDDNVGDYMMRNYKEKLERFSGEERKLREMVFRQRLCRETVQSGCDSMYDVSLSEMGSYEELMGVDFSVPNGFEAILDVIKQNIPSDNIKLNSPVLSVNWDRGGSNNDNNLPVCVTCENGDKLFADHVIVTVSLGYLQKNAEKFFSPSLPKTKLAAISNLGFGCVGKVILEFDEKIVDSHLRTVSLLWNPREQKNGHRPCPEDMRENWFRKIYCWDIIAENVFMGWLSGRECQYMESLTDDQVAADCVAVLEMFLKRHDIPKPTRIIRTSWAHDPYTLGAYTYIPVGSSVADIKTMAEPVAPNNSSTPQILFAGEATHNCFYSTTHGALLTGRREADRLIKLYEEDSESSPQNEAVSTAGKQSELECDSDEHDT